MRNINDIYELLKFVCNKNQRGYISPVEFNRAINAVSLQLFKEKIGLPEEYQPGRPVPRIAFGMTRKVSEDMDPFLEVGAAMANATSTGWVKPANFVYPIAVFTAGMQEVELVDYHIYVARHNSQLLQPSTEHPLATSAGRKVIVSPANVVNPKITYLRWPTEIKWESTMVQGRPVYSAANSVDPEWPQITWNELFTRTLSLFGINLKAQEIVQYSQMKKQEGM